MCLIKDNRTVLATKQVLALVGIVEDQAGGDDRHAKWAVHDVFRPACLDDVALWIDPHLLSRRPYCTRNPEFVRQLNLPLQGQRRWAEDEHWTIAQQDGDQSACSERKRFPDTDFIGEQQTHLAIGLPVLKEHSYER